MTEINYQEFIPAADHGCDPPQLRDLEFMVAMGEAQLVRQSGNLSLRYACQVAECTAIIEKGAAGILAFVIGVPIIDLTTDIDTQFDELSI